MAKRTIEENLTLLQTTKDNIKTALTAKGVSPSDDMTTWSTTIESIPSGDETAFISVIERTCTSVIIPSTTTKIGNGAFSQCKDLISVSIPSTVTSIEESAFSNCTSLASITIPSTVKKMNGQNHFRGCTSLASVTIESEGITEIQPYDFYGTTITKIDIPDTIKSISNLSFGNCSNLEEVNFGNTRTTICSLLLASAFNNGPSTQKIIVPDALYDTWITTSYWSDTKVVSKIVKYSDYYNVA